MTDHTVRTRRRLASAAAGVLLALGSVTAGAPAAGASSGPVPDFDEDPFCLPDIIAISCFPEGTATGGGEIVRWHWEYPGLFSDVASGQSPLLRFETVGVFEVTLTVTDDGGRTGSVTKPMIVDIGSPDRQAQPHTSSAVSTIRASFATCSS